MVQGLDVPPDRPVRRSRRSLLTRCTRRDNQVVSLIPSGDVWTRRQKVSCNHGPQSGPAWPAWRAGSRSICGRGRYADTAKALAQALPLRP